MTGSAQHELAYLSSPTSPSRSIRQLRVWFFYLCKRSQKLYLRSLLCFPLFLWHLQPLHQRSACWDHTNLRRRPVQKQRPNTLANGWFRRFSQKKCLNARGFAREFLRSGMLYRPGKSLKRRGKSSSLHSKKNFLPGGCVFLWMTS